MTGKLPPELMDPVYRYTGSRDPDVLVGPAVGEDAAVIKLPDGHYLVVHSDPITEASARVGWLAVNIAANDIAVTGARPRWATLVILLPEGAARMLEPIVSDAHRAAEKLGIMIVGGHTEESPGLSKPTVVATVQGITRRYVATSGVKPGDDIIAVKHAGIEGTAILATDFVNILERLDVPVRIIEKARRLIEEISVVDPALAIADIADSMHDPTEGGVLGALYEMAYASKTTIEVWEDKIPVLPETLTICDALGIDPLRLISSGCLLAATPPEKTSEALRRLRSKGYTAEVIGVARTGEPKVILHRRDGEVEEITGFVKDEIARLWELAPPHT